MNPDPSEAKNAVPGAESVPIEETAPVPEPAWKKTLKFVLKFGVSAGILTYIICTRDIKWSDFTLVNPWCIVASFLCIYLQLTLTGIRWFSLLRAVGIRCSLWEALSREAASDCVNATRRTLVTRHSSLFTRPQGALFPVRGAVFFPFL